MNELVIRALQKGGINRHYGLHAFTGHTRSKGNGVLFCNAHVVIAIGEALFKLNEARSLAHRRRNANQ